MHDNGRSRRNKVRIISCSRYCYFRIKHKFSQIVLRTLRNVVGSTTWFVEEQAHREDGKRIKFIFEIAITLLTNSLLMASLLGLRPYGLHIRRPGCNPPRGLNVGWRVLTTANTAGTKDLKCFLKHGGVPDIKFKIAMIYKKLWDVVVNLNQDLSNLTRTDRKNRNRWWSVKDVSQLFCHSSSIHY
jgi:hypothetical protein